MSNTFWIILAGTFFHSSHGMRCDSLPLSVRDSIVQVLFVVDEADQQYRIAFEKLVHNKADSLASVEIVKKQKAADSVDLVKVLAIVAKYGWLGVDDIGDQCNTAMFMVIQHADLATQQKYLPMLREAEAWACVR